jgi:sRNA-binding protein
MLCESYPKCFFENPKQRRPLRKDITADITKDKHFVVAPEMITAAVEWYKTHIGYDYAMSIAGAKRIDLDGKEVGTVTEQEALGAKQRIDEINRKNNERAAQSGPVKILSGMHASGRISDDAVKKLDATPMPPTSRSKTATAVAPEFAQLYETITAANAAVVSISDATIRAVVAKATLDAVIKKAQEIRLELESD